MTTLERRLGREAYEATWQAMRAFTDARGPDTDDEIWLLEHHPVYTLGMAGRLEHVLGETDGIPLVRSDRGGQVTYHGPGQLVVYLLLDLKRLGLGVKSLVDRTEQAVIDLLAEMHIEAQRRSGAPGVYVDGAKIAALGFRVRRGCCYHGLALNVDADLRPFGRINPCGYEGLSVTSLAELGRGLTVDETGNRLVGHLAATLSLLMADDLDGMAGCTAHGARQRPLIEPTT